MFDDIAIDAATRLRLIKTHDPKSVEMGDFTRLKESDFVRLVREEQAAATAQPKRPARKRKASPFVCPAWND